MKTEMPPRNLFIAIWIALLILLFAMFGLAHFNLGGGGTALILILGAGQALLVLAYFMRLRESARIVRVAAGTGFFWLLILFVLAFADYLARQWH